MEIRKISIICIMLEMDIQKLLLVVVVIVVAAVVVVLI